LQACDQSCGLWHDESIFWQYFLFHKIVLNEKELYFDTAPLTSRHNTTPEDVLMQVITKTLVTLALISGCTTAIAQGSVGHSTMASQNALQASGHSLAAGSMAVAAIVSIPLQAVGAIGQASGQAGESLADWANQPLTVAEQPIIAGPRPDRMLKAESSE
jgi:hypothetical protein